MTRFLRATVVLMLVGFASVGNAAGPAHNILTFDVPSATFTYPTGINSAGQVTGYYLDATGQQHGFVRSKGGLITTFDVPGSTGTVPQAISQAGLVTGYSNGPINQRGGTFAGRNPRICAAARWHHQSVRCMRRCHEHCAEFQ